MREFLLWILLGTGGLLILACEEQTPDQPIEKLVYCLDESFKDRVELKQVVLQPVTEGIPLTGVVEANPDNVIQFVSLVGGVVTKTYFSLGDRVRKGQVLAELKSAELSTLQAELNSLNARLQVAEKKLESVQSMYEDGIATAKDLMEAEGDVAIYRSDQQKVKAHLDLFSASENGDVFQIKAPSSGIVIEKDLVPGTRISADGGVLFTISDLSEVWVMVDIYATNVRHIENGMKVDVATLSYPDTIFQGTIGAVSQILDSEAKVLKARIVMRNGDLILKPGMLVDVIALKDRKMEAVGIPTSSMVFDHNKDFVVVHRSDCDMEIREVDVLSSNNGTTFISKGLEEHESIITRNHLLVYEQINNLSK